MFVRNLIAGRIQPISEIGWGSEPFDQYPVWRARAPVCATAAPFAPSRRPLVQLFDLDVRVSARHCPIPMPRDQRNLLDPVAGRE
jgi:hypothetical protein